MITPQFNVLIHAPNRLQICAFLAPLAQVQFQVLRSELDVSDSVLSKHIKQLKLAGYVKQRKSKHEGRQRTWVRLVDEGLLAFQQHIEALKRLANMT